MSSAASLQTRWADCLRDGRRPGAVEMREHLLEVHRHSPGFTEQCASWSRDDNGRNSYEWLLDALDAQHPGTVLDLACGSGPLMALCHQRFGGAVSLIGVDMSEHELALARERLPVQGITFHQGMAQQLGFLDDGAIDAVLCHWALTLMDPVAPVLAEVARVLRPGGVFAAIVDGDMATTPCYAARHDIIYDWVLRELPGYADAELGDPRVRSSAALADLARSAFPGADVSIESAVVRLAGKPEELAAQAAGFFYASFVLSPPMHALMLQELTQDFAARAAGKVPGGATFNMPINRLLVRRAPAA
jgi:SAM-dependent methyltransferase